MRHSKVPVDMSSEQKNLMGVVSTRQAIYLLVGGMVIYSYIIPLFSFLFPFIGIVPTIIISIMSIAPVVVVVVVFAFLKIEKYNMFRDAYILIKVKERTQLGRWRKGD